MLRDIPLPRMYDTTPAAPGAGGLGELAVVEPPPPTAHPELYSPENQVRYGSTHRVYVALRTTEARG